ncbi:hypothetical protein HNP67_001222 [Borreliella californiensis]|uniref:Uncharacterized protein n=1 Tax=Borreliella californiensis TaxID=373543 RepID=A0A7W9ZLI8_9SPIR|nr:hypothetical protein [Borreliella californiensis]
METGKFYCHEIFKDALVNIKNWVNEGKQKSNINGLIRTLCVDNNDALSDLLNNNNAELKSIEYWGGFIKDYFNKTNKFNDLNRLEVFISDKHVVYGTSVLKFFCMLKEER